MRIKLVDHSLRYKGNVIASSLKKCTINGLDFALEIVQKLTYI